MARIVDPYNLDNGDDAVFSALLSQGLIWIEDDDEEESYKSEIEVLKSISKGKKRTLKGHKGSVNEVVVSGDFAISASSDTTLRVWNWRTGQSIRTLAGHTSSVNAVVISGDFAVSASSDKTLRVWNWHTGQLLRTLSGYTHEVSALGWDGDVVASASFGEVWLWNWKTGEIIQKLTGWHRSGITDLSVDGDLVLSASSDLLLVRNGRTGENIRRLSLKDDLIDEFENLAVNKDFTVFIDYDLIEAWNWKSGEYYHKTEFPSEGDSKIANRVFATPYAVCIYDAKSKKWYGYMPHDMDYHMVVFADDYSHIITSDRSDVIYVAWVAPALQRLIMGETIAEHRSPSMAHQREKTLEPIPEYAIEAVLEAAHDYIRKRNETWVNFSRVSQHLHEIFPDLKSKKLGRLDRHYPSLIKLIADYPADFELRQDPEKQGLYWIRLKPTQAVNKQPGRKSGTQEAREYNTKEVLRTARKFLGGRNEVWINFSHVVHHLREVFPNINLKRLKLSDNSAKSLIKLIADYPSDFELRQDLEKQGLYWIRLKTATP